MTLPIRTIAINLARTEGLINITRESLCAAAGIPSGSFAHVTGRSFTSFINELRRDPELVDMPTYPVCKTRTNPELRKEHILATALTAAATTGYKRITRREVAEAAGVSEALVQRYFNTMKQLRRAIMRQAVARGVTAVVERGIAERDPQALKTVGV